MNKSVIIALFMLSCKTETKKLDYKDTSDSSKKVAGHEKSAPGVDSFIDSVKQRKDLSIEQISRYTSIDSHHYTDELSNARFYGDTVWTLTNGTKAAIIDYSDMLVCSYKFIVVFTPKNSRSSDAERIYIACDYEEGSANTSLNFRRLNDSVFATVETFTSGTKDNKKEDTTINEIFWKINRFGQIDTTVLTK